MKTLRLYTHPECQRCQRLSRFHARFDWLNRLEHTTETPTCGPLRMGQVIAQDMASGEFMHGHRAMQALCSVIPLYRVFLPLLKLPSIQRSRLDRQLSGCDGGFCKLS